MTTEQKLDEIIDKLLVKTQDGHCQWKRINFHEFVLKTFSSKITLSYLHRMETQNIIVLNVYDNNNTEFPAATITQIDNDIHGNLNRLFDAVKKYYENYANICVDKLKNDIMKLGIPDDPRAYL